MTEPLVYADRAQIETWRLQFDAGTRAAETLVQAVAMDDGTVFHLFDTAPQTHSVGKPATAVLWFAEAAPDAGEMAQRLDRAMPDTGAAGILIAFHMRADGPFPSVVARNGHRIETAALRYFPGAGELQSRARGLIGADALAGRNVGVVGLGSGGSMVALELAQSGVGGFVLIDDDRLEAANLARHACGLGDLGRLKTRAVRDLLRGRNPAVRIATHEFDIRTDAGRLAEALDGCDLVVGATDSDPSRFQINQVAVESGTTAIFGRALSRAYGGDVVRVRPHLGPCLACVFTGRFLSSRRAEITSRRQASEAAPAYVGDAEKDQMVQVGLAADIAPLSNMIVKLALTELARGLDCGIAALEADFVADSYIWVNRREGVYRDLPPLGQGNPGILRWMPTNQQRDPDCPVCGEPAALDTDLDDLFPERGG